MVEIREVERRFARALLLRAGDGSQPAELLKVARADAALDAPRIEEVEEAVVRVDAIGLERWATQVLRPGLAKCGRRR